MKTSDWAELVKKELKHRCKADGWSHVYGQIDLLVDVIAEYMEYAPGVEELRDHIADRILESQRRRK